MSEKKVHKLLQGAIIGFILACISGIFAIVLYLNASSPFSTILAIFSGALLISSAIFFATHQIEKVLEKKQKI